MLADGFYDVQAKKEKKTCVIGQIEMSPQFNNSHDPPFDEIGLRSGCRRYSKIALKLFISTT